jgi:hypothetical protein
MTETLDVTADLRHFHDGYRLGYGTGYEVGFAHGSDDALDLVQSVLTGCTDTFRSPRQDDLRAARDEVPTQPCWTRCRRCSRCARSLAYWGRGGRDYLGTEQELAIQVGTPGVQSGTGGQLFTTSAVA